MSSAEKAAQLLSGMDPRELRILQSIEQGMSQYEFVPLSYIVKFLHSTEAEVNHWIDGLDTKDLLWRQKESYTGYILNYNSYDLLALNALVKGGSLEALGMPLGMGKEADIYEAVTPGGSVALKFHRLGRVSFRETRRKREYIGNRHHISWLYQSRLAAEKEYTALKLAYAAGVSVPKPLEQNRHIIVMEKINGHQLGEVASIEDPGALLDDILDGVTKAYRAGVIHADLSEFNVMVTEGGDSYIIDWPQYVSVDHSQSGEYLERDIRNLLSFFSRKYGVERDAEKTIRGIKASR